MKYILHFFLLLYAFNGYGQIKTPSFTKYNKCPDGLSEISASAGWRQPTGGTCDYFNKCTWNKDISVPNNVFGSQDNAVHTYAGLYTYINGGGWQEYIGTAIPALTVGNTYTMSITVSLADSCSIATDGLGVLFTTYPYSQLGPQTIPLTPQIDYSGYGPIADKINWVTLTGSFIADSPYTHLIVGSFKTYLATVKDTVGPLTYGGLQGTSYYYIGEIGMMDSTYFGDSTYIPPIDTTTKPPIDTTKPPVPDTADYVFPNAFTPNGDGKNDVFRIKGKKGNDYAGYTLRVFNRWGECVYTSNDPNEGWDGRHNGMPAPLGVYFYMANFGLNNEHVLAKGDVTLVR